MKYRLTQNDLKDFGFRTYPVSPIHRHNANWQIDKWDVNGIQFYVNVRWWDNSEARARLASQGTVEDGFDAWCQFNAVRDTFDVTKLSVVEMTPFEIVSWFETIWKALRCDYYERTK